MGFEIPKPKKELIPEGTHLGICVSITDMGTQELVFEGRTSWKRRLRFTWEVPDQRRQWVDDKDVEHDVPMFVSKELTQSLHKRATLTKILKSWGFLDRVLAENNVEVLLGVPAILTMAHADYEGEKYASLESVSPIMDGMSVPEAETRETSFHLGSPDRDVWDAMPDWLKEKIQKAEEWPSAEALMSPAPKTEEQLDDDIGF